MKKFFGGKDNKTRPRRMSLQVIPDNHEVIHFKDDDMDDNAVMKMIQKQRKRRGSLPGPPPNLGQNSKVGQGYAPHKLFTKDSPPTRNKSDHDLNKSLLTYTPIPLNVWPRVLQRLTPLCSP